MNRTALPLLVLLAAGLAAVAAMEVLSTPAMPAATGPALSAVAGAPTAPPPDPKPQQVAALLARPPFSPDRKPDLTAAAGADPRLPHLTGITVAAGDRRAIFAGANGARSAVLGQGDQIGAYRIQAISPAEVTLAGLDGLHVVRPTFSAAPPAGAPPAFAPPAFTPPPQAAPQLPPLPAALSAAQAGQGRSP